MTTFGEVELLMIERLADSEHGLGLPSGGGPHRVELSHELADLAALHARDVIPKVAFGHQVLPPVLDESVKLGISLIRKFNLEIFRIEQIL